MEVFSLYLGVTNDCDLRCTYCMRPKEVKYMPEEVARGAVNWFIDQIPSRAPRVDLTFWGGEPCLNEIAILSAINEIEGRFPGKSTFTISTNGYDFPDALFKHIVDNSKRWNVQISLDGTKESHDKSRRTKEGEGTFEQCLATFKKLRDICNVGIRATIAPWNVHRLFEDLKYLRLLTPQFNVRPMFQASWKDKHYDMLRDGLFQFAVYEAERVRAGSEPCKMIAYPFSSCGIQFTGLCGAGREMVYVDTEGSIWPCADHQDIGKHRLGHIDAPGLNMASKRLFEALSVENFIGCKQCTAVSCTCCHALNLSQTNCELLPPEGYCRAMRIFGEFYIYIEAMLQELGYEHGIPYQNNNIFFDDGSLSLLVKDGNKVLGRRYSDVNAATLDTLLRVGTLLERLQDEDKTTKCSE